jgi:hypothetical protein
MQGSELICFVINVGFEDLTAMVMKITMVFRRQKLHYKRETAFTTRFVPKYYKQCKLGFSQFNSELGNELVS